MFEHEHIDKYEYDDIPLNQDCMLMSEIYMEKFSAALIRMLEGENIDPYTIGYAAYVAVRMISTNSIDLSWFPNVNTRFHIVSISIPMDKIKGSVGCRRYDIKPYIFVDHQWMMHLYTRVYSVFALIDAIGIKNAIQNNMLTKEKMVMIRDRIDALAEKYKNISFISFADSLLIKSNWLANYMKNKIEYPYDPEVFLRIIKEIQSIYREVLNIDIYAILTQGSNEYYDNSLLHISNTKNHICLNSLGLPFAELLAIDTTVKIALKNKVHPPAEVYMDYDFYRSLKFKLDFDRNNKPRNVYKAIMKTQNPYYFYSSCDELLNNLEK